MSKWSKSSKDMQAPKNNPAFWDRFAEDLYVREMPTAELCISQQAPSTFGRIRSGEGLPEITEGHGAAHDYLLALQLAEIPFIEQFLAAKRVSKGYYPAGGISIMPFEDIPRIFLPGPFDTLIVRITQSSLDEIAYSQRMPRVDRLVQKFGWLDSVVHNLGQVLVTTLQQPNHASKLFVDHVLHALHCHLACFYGDIRHLAKYAKGGLTAQQVRRATEFLDAHLDGDIDLQQIAETCKLSVSHFARAFRQTFGKPPYRWLIERRIDKATALMTHSRLPIADIALRCGFADQSGFNRSFKRIHGVAPGIWRRTVIS